jgi:ABC-type transporter Mla MlaB component
MLRNFEVLKDDPEAALDLYFQQCSILVECRDLAMIAATLANGGVNPATGERAVRQDFVESILSVMTTCGMYDFAGEWMYAVGMPAKSGVAGGVMAVLPGQLGLAVFSPRLDPRGNSVRGVAVCSDVSRDFNLHCLRAPRAARAVVRAAYDLGAMRSRRLRTGAERALLDAEGGCVRIFSLQGDLSFAAVEHVIRRVVEHEGPTDAVVFDVARVARIDGCAVVMLAELVRGLADAGTQLLLVGHDVHARFVRQLEERLVQEGSATPSSSSATSTRRSSGARNASSSGSIAPRSPSRSPSTTSASDSTRTASARSRPSSSRGSIPPGPSSSGRATAPKSSSCSCAGASASPSISPAARSGASPPFRPAWSSAS